MTPLAILKDSIRENRDSKILLVLMILSIIFAVLLLSMSFEPIAADTIIGKSDEYLPRLAFNHGKFSGDPRFSPRFNFDASISNFQEIKAARNPANGKYSFVLTITSGDRKSVTRSPFEPIKKAPAPTKDKEKEKEKEKAKDKEPEKKDPNQLEADPFIFAVFVWNTDIQAEQEKILTGKPSTLTQDKIEVPVSQMETWVKEVYNFYLNANIEKATLRPQTKPDEFVFDVETGTSDPRQWPHTAQLFFGSVDLKKVIPPVSLGRIVFNIQNYLTNGFGAAIAIILGVMITSFFIPNMLRKGAIDIMLSKPINRFVLLVYKFFGGMIFMLLFSTVAVGTIYLALGIRTGLWNPAPLLLIPLLSYSFGVLYAVNTLFAVWTRSGIAAMLVTLAFSAFLWVLSFAYNQVDQIRTSPIKEILPDYVYTIADVTNAVLPRTRDLDVMSSKILMDVMTESDQNKMPESKLTLNYFATFGVSGLYIFLFVGLACWIFSKKNF